MADLSRVRARRVALVSVLCTFAMLGVAAVPGVAAGTPLQATFQETTSLRPCPATAPPGAMCFNGVGSGLVTLPGSPGNETFAGFVDEARADKGTHCAPDFNVVTISTDSGMLFLQTQGVGCPQPTSPPTTVDIGKWTAFGGTGIFEDARGGGEVSTLGTFGASGITSTSTYTGTLVLNH